MKKIKFLFVAVVLTCFVGINQSNAQGAVVYGWENSTYENVTITDCNGNDYSCPAVKNTVITPSGIKNFIAFGELHADGNWECMIPEENGKPYVDENPSGAVITIYSDGTFKAVKHDKSGKKHPKDE